MELTRRGRGVAGLALALVALAGLLARPLLLGGATLVGGWLLARQWRFVAEVAAAREALSVSASPARKQVSAGESVAVTMAASLPSGLPLRLSVRAEPPVGTTAPDADKRSVIVQPGATEARTTFPLSCPVAGRHRFQPASVAAEDPDGLFESGFAVDDHATLHAAARAPTDVHVGEGGERIATFGEHDSGEQGPGLQPAELRN